METKKTRIGIDVDDVVIEFFNNYLKFFNSHFGKNVTFKDISRYHIWELELGVSKEEALSIVVQVHNSEHPKKTSLVEGAKESINNLSKKYEIFFVTSRPTSVKERTISFLKEIFPELKFEIIFSGDIHGNAKTKAEICFERGITTIIEDSASYAFDCAQKGVRAFLLDKPWNQEYEQHENLIKVKDWNEIVEHLN